MKKATKNLVKMYRTQHPAEWRKTLRWIDSATLFSAVSELTGSVAGSRPSQWGSPAEV